MEWALFIKRADELLQLEEDNGYWFTFSPSSFDPLHPASQEFSFTRIYYGNEFCEAVIPSRKELEKCLFASLERGLSFTFVTPHVTDRYLAALGDCFNLISRNTGEAEVVVNDWGVLRLLRKHHNALVPVLGRILNRSLFDYRRSNVTSLMYFPFRRFLWNYGVRRVEFDCPAQTMGVDLEKAALGGSLYFPFDCCTITHQCPGDCCSVGTLWCDSFSERTDESLPNTLVSLINRVIHKHSTHIQE